MTRPKSRQTFKSLLFFSLVSNFSSPNTKSKIAVTKVCVSANGRNSTSAKGDNNAATNVAATPPWKGTPCLRNAAAPHLRKVVIPRLQIAIKDLDFRVTNNAS
ncbi:hypothetical protein M0R45_036360 [Rubus argutus]|uniref:Uncharacterized protein n=1 Tax=Rubus argutus TaxID=59490 RepID=A0AAW1VYL8_RUBAR